MDGLRIDHVNLRIPEDGITRAIEFYDGVLGFQAEGVDEYRAGETSIFHFRISSEAIVHVLPTTDFVPPERENFDHLAIIIDGEVSELKRELSSQQIAVERESTPSGATGQAPAIYIRDPFGYRIELKESVTEPV